VSRTARTTKADEARIVRGEGGGMRRVGKGEYEEEEVAWLRG